MIKKSSEVLSKALKALKSGGVVICPTDTVYGFLADAQNKKAVDRIFKIKKRPKSKPLSVFVKNLRMAEELAFVDQRQEKVLKKYWPGKYTFVLKRKPAMELFGLNKATIAIRIPKHTFLQKLLKKINRPLVQTSVNISDQPTLVEINDIIKTFGDYNNIPIIDGGNLKKGKPSKIIDLTQGVLTRIR